MKSSALLAFSSLQAKSEFLVGILSNKSTLLHSTPSSFSPSFTTELGLTRADTLVCILYSLRPPPCLLALTP